MVILSLGSNVGDRFENLRQAISELGKTITIKQKSVVFETKAILPKDAIQSWDMNYLNMIIIGEYGETPENLLKIIQNIESKLGRGEHEHWAPRTIDIDILYFNDKKISTDTLIVPHKEIESRSFLRSLLNTIGFNFNDSEVNNYSPENAFVLDEPNLVGIVNITPDSFSDGGNYNREESAIAHIEKLSKIGTKIIELGAQSTRPGYIEISANEEIDRLHPILERTRHINNLGVDTYFDDVIKFVIKNFHLKWINNIKENLADDIIKLIADEDAELVIMANDLNLEWLRHEAKRLENLGIKHEKLVIDPGIGFGKTKFENLRLVKNLKELKKYGYKILLGHSRKSFISIFSNATARERDIETLAVSDFANDIGIDYLRIHNVENHIKYFVTKKVLDLKNYAIEE